jgi:two-component system copper resistance phosphate regulon response regulator CusR
MTSKILEPKILLIGKDKKLLKVFIMCLNTHHFKIINTLEEGINYALTNRYNLLLINTDINIEKNFNLLEYFRARNKLYPILVVGPNNPKTEINAYKLGINIYHSEPIKYDLLKAQISQLSSFFQEKIIFELGEIIIDIHSKTFQTKNKKVVLTDKEITLLSLLIKAEGRIMSRDIIYAHICDHNKDTTYGAIDTMVSRLRNKLKDLVGDKFIETVYHAGYRINPQYFEKYNITRDRF